MNISWKYAEVYLQISTDVVSAICIIYPYNEKQAFCVQVSERSFRTEDSSNFEWSNHPSRWSGNSVICHLLTSHPVQSSGSLVP